MFGLVEVSIVWVGIYVWYIGIDEGYLRNRIVYIVVMRKIVVILLCDVRFCYFRGVL